MHRSLGDAKLTLVHNRGELTHKSLCKLGQITPHVTIAQLTHSVLSLVLYSTLYRHYERNYIRSCYSDLENSDLVSD